MISNAFSADHVKLCAWAGSCGGSRPRFARVNFLLWCFAIGGLACIPVPLGVTSGPVVKRDSCVNVV